NAHQAPIDGHCLFKKRSPPVHPGGGGHHTRFRPLREADCGDHWMRLGRKYHWPSERSQLSTSLVWPGTCPCPVPGMVTRVSTATCAWQVSASSHLTQSTVAPVHLICAMPSRPA